jgi:lipopolysaccharide transport system ATP-binding protein
MYVRLAFAVAAHLRSEILVVDEVLAVGDAEFQRKCLGKMKEVSTDGRTVLFVSHSMHSISQLCDSALLLTSGRAVERGSVESAARGYAASFDDADANVPTARVRRGSGEYRFSQFSATDRFFEPAAPKRFTFSIERHRGDIGKMYVAVQVYDEVGVRLLNLDSRLVSFWLSDGDAFHGELCIKTPWLKPGRYRLDAYICTGSGIVDLFEGAAHFEVTGAMPYEGNASEAALQLGSVFGDFEWHVVSPTKVEAPLAQSK